MALLFALLMLAAIAAPAEGATWSTVPTLGPEGFSEGTLGSVSCTPPAFCVAVGTADDGYEEFEPPTHVASFSEVWDGSSWRVAPTADPVGAGAALASVSCVSPSFCVAVGGTHSDALSALRSGFYDASRALLEVWNGSSWSVVPTPAGARPHSGLSGVSCLSASFCIAVGSSFSEQATGQTPLLEVWNGSAWELQGTPFAARHGSPFFGITCASRNSCMAVGSYNANPHTGVPENEALAEHWNGHRWSVEHPPTGRLYFPSLEDVSCPSRSDCMAVGHYYTSQNDTANGPLVERWRAGRWKRVTAGLPKYASLTDVSCVGVDRCVAVGRHDTALWPADDKTSPLILSWDGSRWARESTPAVPSSTTESESLDPLGPFLFGISCPAQGGCTAVGVQPSGNTNAPLALSTSESFAEPTPAVPTPKITAAPGATTTGRTASFEFESNVAGATFECRLEGEGVVAALSRWIPCTSPRSYSALSPGQKRFSVRAVVDAARSAAATDEWTVLKPGAPKPVVLPVVGGHAIFHATCPLDERCRERVVVKAGAGELGSGGYSIPAGGSKHVQIRLTASGERLLAHRSQVAATLVIENLHTHKRAEVPVLLVRR
ncbi:MAG: hypothetical protein ACRDPE_18100 [Solirubrobacterales bacterium]